MRKVELTEAEAAALIAMTDVNLSEAEGFRSASRGLILSRESDDKARLQELNDYDYWTERVHLLRKLKAKLELEEPLGPALYRIPSPSEMLLSALRGGAGGKPGKEGDDAQD